MTKHNYDSWKVPHERTASVRMNVDQHSCRSDNRWRNTKADARFVATEIEDNIRNHKFFKPRGVIVNI